MPDRERATGDGPSPAGIDAPGGRPDSDVAAATPPPPPGSTAAATSPKFCPQCGLEYESALNFCPRDGNILQVRHGEHDLVGRMLGQHYRVLERLGEGGMGQVFLGEHVRIGRRCAIKVMRPALVRDPGAVGRFGREAKTAGRINHRNAAAIYDFGETDDGLIYIVMEHVEGPPLSDILIREGALSPRRAVELAVQLADALGAAHRLGIIHRDLKPDNVLITRDENGRDLVKVVDFGIAKAMNDADHSLTRTGFVLGTLQYMSPEQLIGETLDGRSDLYSLGCILFEMLTGERTFAGPSGPAAVARRLTEPAPSPISRNPAVPPELDALVLRALARTPAERFQSAEEMRAALLGVLAAGLGTETATMPSAAPAALEALTPGHMLRAVSAPAISAEPAAASGPAAAAFPVAPAAHPVAAERAMDTPARPAPALGGHPFIGAPTPERAPTPAAPAPIASGEAAVSAPAPALPASGDAAANAPAPAVPAPIVSGEAVVNAPAPAAPAPIASKDAVVNAPTPPSHAAVTPPPDVAPAMSASAVLPSMAAAPVPIPWLMPGHLSSPPTPPVSGPSPAFGGTAAAGATAGRAAEAPDEPTTQANASPAADEVWGTRSGQSGWAKLPSASAPSPDAEPAVAGAEAAVAPAKPRRARGRLPAAALLVIATGAVAFALVARWRHAAATAAADAAPSTSAPTAAASRQSTPPAPSPAASDAPTGAAPRGQTSEGRTARAGDAPASNEGASRPGAQPAAPPARPAVIRIAGRLPAGAIILVDGQRVSGRSLTVAAGAHSFAVLAAGYQPFRWSGALGGGDRRVWTVELQPVATAAASQPAPSARPNPPAPGAPAVSTPVPPPSAPTTAPVTVSPPPTPRESAASQPVPSEESADRARATVALRERTAATDLAAAISARDMASLQRAWPGMSPKLIREWQLLLTSPDNRNFAARALSLGPPQIAGAAATAAFTLEVAFTNQSSGKITSKPRFTASFQRTDTGWKLTEIRAEQ